MKSNLTTVKSTGYGYGRYSDESQERGDSERRQIKITDYGDKHHISILKIFFDPDVSGKDGLNLVKEFGELLKVIKPGQLLLCENFDRMGRRHPFKMVSLLYDIVESGVEVVFLEPFQIVNQDNIDDFALTVNSFIQSAVAHQENTKKGKRVHESFVNRLEAVFEHNTPLSHYGPCWITFDHDKKAYVYDKDKIKTIEYIFKMALDGVGILKITQRLNDENEPVVSTRKDTTHWSPTPVNKLLKNKACYGCFESKDGRSKDNHYKPIVTKETFYKVQELLHGRMKGHGGGRPSNFVNLYKDLAKCWKCGSSMNHNSKYKKTHILHYLECHQMKIGVCKPYISQRFEPFDLSFRKHILSDHKTILKAFSVSEPSKKSKTIEMELLGYEKRLNEIQSSLADPTKPISNMIEKVILQVEGKIKTLKNDLDLEMSREATVNEIPRMLRSYFITTPGMFIVNPKPQVEWTNDKLKTFIERIEINVADKTYKVVLKDSKATSLVYSYKES